MALNGHTHITRYSVEYSLDQRDKYGHLTPTGWL
jgi:hypothetical protein